MVESKQDNPLLIEAVSTEVLLQLETVLSKVAVISIMRSFSFAPRKISFL